MFRVGYLRLMVFNWPAQEKKVCKRVCVVNCNAKLNYDCVHMWVPLGNTWVILGEKEQAHLPAARPFTHHICPHSSVVPSKPAKAICHPAPRCSQVGQEWCRLIVYSQMVEGASVLKKIPFPQPFRAVCQIQYISFSFIYKDSLAKSIVFPEGEVQAWVWM